MSKVVYLPAVQSLQSALPAFENEPIGVACSTEQAPVDLLVEGQHDSIGDDDRYAPGCDAVEKVPTGSTVSAGD
jgi:hypothetical protein